MKRIVKPILSLFFAVVIVGCSDDDDNTPQVEEAEAVTIVDAAIDNGNFTTLVAALQAADLVTTLDDPDATFTVFAPTDAAFALLGQDTIDGLLQDTDTLSDILTYHVISGLVGSNTAIGLAGMTADTVNGAKIGLSLDGDDLLVNTATVIQTDLITDNGIIHVIDAVLMPPTMSDMTPTMNIVETAVDAGSFTTLVSALQATGLDSVLADESMEYTVFAPTDAAFSMIDAAVLDRLLENPDDLSAILLQHVVMGSVDSVTAFSLNGQDAATAAGTTEMPVTIPVAINSTTDMLTFGGAQVVTKDIQTTNGVIHVIDMVVVADATIPAAYGNIAEVASANGSFDILVQALTDANLVGVVSDQDANFTVFAPTDAAFEALGLNESNVGDLDNLSEILLYHVLSSEVKQDAAVTLAQSDMNTTMTANTAMDNIALSMTDSSLYVNTSMVTLANVFADNGVIHVIDKVLLPPSDPATSRSTQNIAEIAQGNDDLETLVTALVAADLVDALSDETATYTVFAPTDAAFAALPDGVLDGLLADIPALTDILELHVVSGAEVDSVTAMSLNGQSATTLDGEMVGISIMSNMLKVGGANVSVTDVYASNGVIHIIDAVITEGESAM